MIWSSLRAIACLCQTSLRSSKGNREESWERLFLCIISPLKKLGDNNENIPGSLEWLLDVPMPSSCQSWAESARPLVCVWVTDKWCQKWPFSVIIPAQRGTRRRSMAWTMPLPEVLTASWHPATQPPLLQLGHRQYLSRKGMGSRGRKGSHRDPEVVRSVSGFSIVCPEENLLALGAKHVCARMGFKNSNRTLSVLKGLMWKVCLSQA